MIPTATGPVAPEELGMTLMHEHVFVLSPEIDRDYAEFVHWNRAEKVELAASKLREAKDAGVSTIIDMTVLGMGRDVDLIAEVSRRSGVRVVVASGYYTFDGLPHFLRHVGPGGTLDRRDPMIDMFIKDVTVGIGDTGVKAALLKCATDIPGLTPSVERTIRAVAQAQKATGVLISTHTHAESRRGLDQQRVLTEEGVDLSRVLIGHCGDTNDLDYLKEMADRGSTLGMDRFGLERPPFLNLEERVNVVAQLCREGYSDRLVLSHDASCWNDWLPPELTKGTAREMPDWTFTHISLRVIPALLEAGISENQVKEMLFENPVRLLGKH